MSHLELELEIQRCIDGQMPEKDQQALLRRLEASPDGWRKLSLAFVENQVWSQTIEKGATAPLPEPVPAAVPKAAEKPLPAPPRSPAFGLWGKVTASMAAGIMAGLVINRQWTNSPVAGPLTTGTVAAASASPAGGSGSQQAPVSATGAAALASNRPGGPEILSDQARQQLKQSGYAVDEGQMYYTIPMPDGRHYIVPVQTMRVRNAVQ